MPSLFLDHEYRLSFEKIAMPVKLSDQPEAWQREIASEIFKQLPYLSDYAVNVIVDRVDPQRGYAFGSAEVSNLSDAPQSEQEKLPKVRIPLIVKDRLLQPLDVFMDGEGVFPLGPDRLREHLFRPDTFEMTTRKPKDNGMFDQLFPPSRSTYGMSGVGAEAMGFDKLANPAEAARRAMIQRMKAEASANPEHLASARPSLVDSIASTIPEEEAEAFVHQIADDPALSVAVSKNDAFSKLAMTIASARRVPLEKTAEALVESIKPTVVQFQKLASGNFRVKWANASAFAPQEGVVPPGDASAMAGQDLSGMQAGETTTVSTEKAKKQSLTEPVYSKVTEFGHYHVHNADTNEELAGWVMPIVDFEMQPLELYVFVTPEGMWSVQDEIVGLAMPHDLSGFVEIMANGSQPQGDGVFVKSGAPARSLLPITVQNSGQGPDGGFLYQAETVFGEPITIHAAEGLQEVQQVSESEYVIPSDLRWLPLPEEAKIFLVKSAEDLQNVQQAQAAPGAVDVGGGNGQYSLEGAPVEKLARDKRQFLKKADAEFLLVGMGLTVKEAAQVFAKVDKFGKTKVAELRPITPLATVHREMVKKAAARLQNFPYGLKLNLVKEAAVLEDSDTVDKILAMNFLNPENVAEFTKALPQLDEASSKLAEMLVASRLGLNQVEEGAVERSMKGLETVIGGLKGLQQKDMM